MRIGINASFLRKPGTGIGQVSFNFINELMKLNESRIPARPTGGKNQESGGDSQFSILNSQFFLYTEEEADVKVPDNFHVRTFLPRLWKRDDLLRKFLWERRLAREAKRDGCDVLLCLYQSAVAPRGMRHVMVVHDLIPRIFPEYQATLRKRFYWRRVERGIKRADCIVAVSQATKHDLVEWDILEEKIVVASPDTAALFHRAVSESESLSVLHKYALSPGYIYHGGGLEVRKNTERLLRAYKELVTKEEASGAPKELPPLVISGKIFPESNPLATPVKRLVQELGLDKQVVLLDFVPETDLPALYKNAIFFAYPSLYEGFGLPVLEALRMGTPVLTADNSSLPEVAGDAALYVDASNVLSIASGMERLLTDAPLREKLRAASRAQADKFHPDHFVKTVLHCLQPSQNL